MLVPMPGIPLLDDDVNDPPLVTPSVTMGTVGLGAWLTPPALVAVGDTLE